MKLINLILLCLFLVIMTNVKAQDSIRIKVVNQYEAPVGKFIYNQKEYQTGADGYAVVENVSADSVFLSGKDYEQITIARALISEGEVITLKKKFTWKDLLNPMFYVMVACGCCCLSYLQKRDSLPVSFCPEIASCLLQASIALTLHRNFLNLSDLAICRMSGWS
jgi:hypothetical protein